MTALISAVGVLVALAGFIAFGVRMLDRKAKAELELEFQRDADESERRAARELAKPRARERTVGRLRKGTF